MPAYTSRARSNYFLVKDLDAFKAALAKYGLITTGWEDRNRGDLVLNVGENMQRPGAIALFAFGGWPGFDEGTLAARLDLDDEADLPADLTHENLSELVAEHLVDGEVAVFTEVGFENMRYLHGTAVAVNAAGATRRVCLDDIYELAKGFAHRDTPITRAES